MENKILKRIYRVVIEEVKISEYPDTDSLWVDSSGDVTTNYDRREKTILKENGKILTRQDRRDLYIQEVDTIDLPAVIKAINNL